MSDWVFALAVDGTGTLFAGGWFANYIAKWDGTTWSALGSGMNGGYIDSLIVDGSGNLFAGGRFTTAGDKCSAYIAEWMNPEPVPSPIIGIVIAMSIVLYRKRDKH